MSDELRLFVGIDVGPIWTETLSATADELAETLRRTGRFVRADLYHVTVLFLGNQPPEAVDSISEALAIAASRVQPFELRLHELVRFGRHEHGALVAAVDDPSGRLQRLRNLLDAELRARHIEFDARGLVPHVTLVRPRGKAGPLPFAPVEFRTTPSLLVSEINLIRSELLRSGPRYRTIATAHVGTAGPG